MNKIIIIAIIFIGSCSSVITINNKTDSNDILIHNGDIANIELESQISTGYNWILVSSEGFNLIDKEIFDSIISDDPLTGKKEKQIFRFRAEKKGRGLLIFNYVKKWEVDKKPEKTFIKSFQIE